MGKKRRERPPSSSSSSSIFGSDNPRRVALALAVAALATALSCRRLAEAAEAYVATASPYGKEVQFMQIKTCGKPRERGKKCAPLPVKREVLSENE